MIRTCLLLLLLLLGLNACQPDMERINQLTYTGNMPTEKAEGMEIQFADSGLLKAKIFSPVLENYQGDKKQPYLLMPKGLRAYFYNPEGKIESSITANWGKYLQKERLVELQNNVVAVNNKGDTLKTEKLLWNEETRIISSDKFVTIKTEDQVIFGEGFESDQFFTNYKIFKIRGTVKVDKN